MKLLSFDVGVKNLSGCFLELNEENVVIYWWGIINLLDENTDTCACNQANGSICGKPAKWSGNGTFYCSRHKSKYTPTELLAHPHSLGGHCTTCGKKAKFDISGDALCGAHTKNMILAHKRMTDLKPIKKALCTKQAVDVTKVNLWHRLDALPYLLSADIVLIENQPAMKNPTMKAVAETLYNYWLCRGIIDKTRTHSRITSVKYVSAANKMKVIATSKTALQGLQGAAKYMKTKELSVGHVASLLEDDADGLHFFQSHRKCDDLSDALTQALAFGIMNGDAKVITSARYQPFLVDEMQTSV